MVVAGRVLESGDVAIMMVEAGATENAWNLIATGATAPTEAVVAEALEAANLPYGPIRQPHDLLDDAHLNAGGALLKPLLPDGSEISTAALPIEFDGRKAGKRCDPPVQGGQTHAILQGLGLDAARIDALRAAGVIA
ncbi:hypothetical protein G6F55_014222 [Rhizopus delemar]|nr:hypothetical protein G6F55_014222 [Rhizopus delemar]